MIKNDFDHFKNLEQRTLDALPRPAEEKPWNEWTEKEQREWLAAKQMRDAALDAYWEK